MPGHSSRRREPVRAHPQLRGAIACVALCVLPACGDGVGQPILNQEEPEEPVPDAGLSGSAGSDASAGDASAASNPAEYCARVEAWPEAAAQLEEQIVAWSNAFRVFGVGCSGDELDESPPLLADEDALRCAARVHTRDMIERDYREHVSPDGEGPEDRIVLAGYPLGEWAEVIGELDLERGTDSLGVLLSEEGEDCDKLLDPRFDAVGVGYYEGVWTIVLAGPLQLSP